MLEELVKLWPIIAFIISVVVGTILWGSRLESKNKACEDRLNSHSKQIDHLQNRVDVMENGLSKELTQVREALARIEGYLKGLKEGTRLDA
jgi:hypothetical protein